MEQICFFLEYGIIITKQFSPHMWEWFHGGVTMVLLGVKADGPWLLHSSAQYEQRFSFLPNHSGWLSSTRHCRWTSLSFRYSTCAASSIRNLIETVRHELCSMPASTFSFFLLKTNIWEIDYFSHLFSLSYLKTILLRTNKKCPNPALYHTNVNPAKCKME